ncbi:transmembrane protein 254 isoform X1 [Labeo rohita]|uniref:transmembrane protein 254 isoform X1 n=1 Tax=Labeo rohita TaxID=84645 RepID=UPI0021E1DDB6|nr:transmembrane protein 254 isoform X1 [Labeo rohita]
MAKSDGYSYFRRSSLFWMVTVTISLSFYTWTVFWPQDVPYGSLGPLGALAKHLVDNHYPVLYYGWFLTWAIHLFEALFALKICRCELMDWSGVNYLWITVMYLSAVWTLILTAPIHYRGSIGETVME